MYGFAVMTSRRRGSKPACAVVCVHAVQSPFILCRFLGVSAVEMPQWAPFGDGGRNCVGMKLAVEEAKARGIMPYPRLS